MLELVSGTYSDLTDLRQLALTDERWVPGRGPDKVALAYVGEAPGSVETHTKIPFTGPSGEINWQLAGRYGGLWTGAREAYVTNWRKIPFSDWEKKHITDAEKAQWSALLAEELAERQPSLVLALGGYAVESLLGPGHSLYWTNGLPIKRTAGDFTVIPIVHPAAGIHDSDALPPVAHGYTGVGRYLRGELEARTQGQWGADPVTCVLRPRRVEDIDDAVGAYGVAGLMVAIDTEGWANSPFCLTFSIDGIHAFLIYASDAVGLAVFWQWLHRCRPTILMHNSIHDAGVLRAMGGNVWDFDVIDTMVLAYELQDLPLGLKDLTKRRLWVNMREYESVVEPWRAKAEAEWIGKAYEQALQRTEFTQQFTAKTSKPRMSKGSPVFKRTGDPTPLRLVLHVERQQQLSPPEVTWAEQAIQEKRPKLDLSLVPASEHVDYAGKDAGVTWLHGGPLIKRVKDEGLEAVMQLDHAVLPLVEDMQLCGMHLSVEKYWEVLGYINAEKTQTRDVIREVVGAAGWPEWKDFNPGSGDQVADFCNFVYKREGRLGLTEMTKSGARESVDAAVLEKLRDDHPFIPLQLSYKELEKYEGTYLLPLMPLIGADSRLHTNLRVTKVVSGRLSAHGPNVLAWPARTKLGLMVRSIFTAPEGMVLGSWDLSQIELRIAAALSHDPVLTEAFVLGRDPHTHLASRLFHVDYDAIAGSDDLKLRYRTPAKNIHYMMLYGGGEAKLFEMMGGAISFAECRRIMQETWRVYRVVLNWLSGAGDEARRTGEVRDFLGRRRYLPACRLVGDRWPVAGLRFEAERQGGNFKIQGAAAELLKRSMVTVWEVVYPELRAAGQHFRLWLQVHDELFGELAESAWARVDKLMVAAMTQDSWLLDPISIQTKGVRGSNWAELKG